MIRGRFEILRAQYIDEADFFRRFCKHKTAMVPLFRIEDTDGCQSPHDLGEKD